MPGQRNHDAMSPATASDESFGPGAHELQQVQEELHDVHVEVWAPVAGRMTHHMGILFIYGHRLGTTGMEHGIDSSLEVLRTNLLGYGFFSASTKKVLSTRSLH